MRTPFDNIRGKVGIVIYTKPIKCGGECLYCFSQPGYPQSFLENEDTLRAKACGWDPGRQIEAIFQAYGLPKGHGAKCDITVLGGSFTEYPEEYLRNYAKGIYDCLNDCQSSSLEEAIEIQEHAPDRCVIFSVESRPELITIEMCRFLVSLGVTTVELGVQSLNPLVLSLNGRRYRPEEVIEATYLLRSFGLKVGYHIMVGLVGSQYDEEISSLASKIWANGYCPDNLKIYPCVLLKGNYGQHRLMKYFQQGWRPFDNNRYERLLLEVKPHIPPYAKISRIQRILEPGVILAGPSSVIDRRVFAGICKCISHRAIGWKISDLDADYSNYSMKSLPQNDGFYLEAVHNDSGAILGYARVSPVGDKGNAVVRELRVLGKMRCLRSSPPQTEGIQHIGIGRALMEKIETIVLQKGWKDIYINAGVGARQYFRKLGYVRTEHYMVKSLTDKQDDIQGVT